MLLYRPCVQLLHRLFHNTALSVDTPRRWGAISRQDPFGIGVFAANENDQPTGRNLAAPFGVGNKRLSDAKQVGKLGLCFRAGYEPDALHL